VRIRAGFATGTYAMPSLILILALVSQLAALVLWGHTVYLWVQSVEALIAAAVMTTYAVRYRTGDPRPSRWPPLPPLAAIALFGAIKNVYVINRPETPALVVVCLLASVGWFVVATLMIWRVENRRKAIS
jgi:hypothetical protein